MKKILLSILFAQFIFCVTVAQIPTKPKHLLPNGEVDRPFTFFVKHGFSCYTDAATRSPFESRPAYNFGGGVRVEDDDKDSPAFLEVEGMYSNVTGLSRNDYGVMETTYLSDLRVSMNFYFVLLNNSTKSFRWNAGTGVGWNSIKNQNTVEDPSKFGVNFISQAEMLLKHKRLNVFANYHLIPFTSGFKSYNYNTLSLGMGFYFR